MPPDASDATSLAAPRGSITVVGIGPGDLGLLTPCARAALATAEVVVGYAGYLDRIGELIAGKDARARELGQEAERAAEAIAAARAGRRVAVVSSGDAGVYGMASVVLELAGDEFEPPIVIEPGVTAATAAAARLGAPLGHDFCVISLSDLLTPWAAIERRLVAAADADFVIAIYNPASARRGWQLPRAKQRLLERRPSETVVGIVDRAFQPDERVWTTTLGELDPASVGMFSILIIGASATRRVANRLVTPRGYAMKSASPAGPTECAGRRENQAGGSAIRAVDPIQAASFQIIERRLAERGLLERELPPGQFAIIRRVVHATADFEFAASLRFHPGAIARAVELLRAGAAIVTDVEMLRAGIRRDFAGRLGCVARCSLDEPAASQLAAEAGITRSAAGIRLASETTARPIVAVGSAPTALDEALRLVERGGWRPGVIIGLPVGFVGVELAKARLMGQSASEPIPFITNVGPKGGTAAAAAVVNALLELAAE